jgi:undecaprenyl-diphosphatase
LEVVAMNGLQKLNAFDTRAFFWCNDYSQHAPVKTGSRWVSRLGDGGLYLLLGLTLALWEPEDGPAFLQVGLLAYAIELPLCHRLAGFRAAIEPSDKFSFPSGHTSAAFVFAMLLSQFYPALMVPGFILALLIGAARVLLGVHYPTDIAAGALLGVVSALLALGLWEWL